MHRTSPYLQMRKILSSEKILQSSSSTKVTQNMLLSKVKGQSILSTSKENQKDYCSANAPCRAVVNTSEKKYKVCWTFINWKSLAIKRPLRWALLGPWGPALKFPWVWKSGKKQPRELWASKKAERDLT